MKMPTLLQLLTRRGADVLALATRELVLEEGQFGRDARDEAACYGRLDLLVHFVSLSALPTDGYALFIAAKYDHVHVVRWLLDQQGWPPDDSHSTLRALLEVAALHSADGVCEWLLQHETLRTLSRADLNDALELVSDVRILRRFVERGADAKSDLLESFHSTHGALRVLWLLRHGATWPDWPDCDFRAYLDSLRQYALSLDPTWCARYFVALRPSPNTQFVPLLVPGLRRRKSCGLLRAYEIRCIEARQCTIGWHTVNHHVARADLLRQILADALLPALCELVLMYLEDLEDDEPTHDSCRRAKQSPTCRTFQWAPLLFVSSVTLFLLLRALR